MIFEERDLCDEDEPTRLSDCLDQLGASMRTHPALAMFGAEERESEVLRLQRRRRYVDGRRRQRRIA